VRRLASGPDAANLTEVALSGVDIMNRCVLAFVLVLSLASLASAQSTALPMVYATTPPVLDGSIGPEEWMTPAVDVLTGASGGVLKSGSFSGESDLWIQAQYLFSADQLYVRVWVRDNLVTPGDALSLDLGMVTLTIRDGVDPEGPTGDWEVVGRTGEPWDLEIRVPLSLLGPTTGASLNLRYVDDDGGADGELWRNEEGGGVLAMSTPQVDLLTAATLLEGLHASFEDAGNLAKQARRLRKAADDSRWSDVYTHVDKSAASKSLKYVRKVIKKVLKYQGRVDAARASQLDAPLALMIGAARLSAWRLVRMARQEPYGWDGAYDKLVLAEEAYLVDDLEEAARQYRKAAKKAAKVVF
jgi:hypothetical protein